MRLVRSLVVLGVGALVLLLADGVFAQPSPDYIKITPPPGMRWKTLDQSGITSDITFVDKDGNTWLRKSAAATFARSFVLVQLVGDSGGTDQWMDLVENLPRFLGLRPDPDWTNYNAFTVKIAWRSLIAQEEALAFVLAGPNGTAVPRSVVLPVYRSASDSNWVWRIRLPRSRDQVATSSIATTTRNSTTMGRSRSAWRATSAFRKIISCPRGHPARADNRGCRTGRAGAMVEFGRARMDCHRSQTVVAPIRRQSPSRLPRRVPQAMAIRVERTGSWRRNQQHSHRLNWFLRRHLRAAAPRCRVRYWICAELPAIAQ